MKSRQTGFTLVELVMVIVIIGILAAIAVPKFLDLSGDAQQAAVNGTAGALSSAAAITYAGKKAGNAAAVALVYAKCDDVGPLLQGGLPTGYSINTTAFSATPGAVNTCTVTGQGSKTATFSAISP